MFEPSPPLAADGTYMGTAPGRVNLVGEHLDYNGGRCLPIALGLRTTVWVHPRDDDKVFIDSGHLRWRGQVGESPGSWAAYPMAALHQIAEPRGCDIRISSDVPWGAGLASSAALLSACTLAFSQMEMDISATGWDETTVLERAIAAETDGVGAPTGGLDQRASLSCRSGHALLIDFSDGDTQHVKIDWRARETQLLIIDTRTRHRNSSGLYGTRRQECEQAARTLGIERLADAHRANARWTAPDQRDAAQVSAHDTENPTSLRPDLAQRVEHVVSENRRVAALVEAIEDPRQCGSIMLDSHESLRDDMEVSSPELDLAVDVTVDSGAYGARMTGGGFGGSAIALVPNSQVRAVVANTARAFAHTGWKKPRVFTALPSAGAFEIAKASTLHDPESTP